MQARYFRAGAWLWILTGALHDALDLLTRMSPPPAEAALNAAMREQPFDYFGLSRNHYEVNMGISLGMGLAMIFVGVLFLFIHKISQDVSHVCQAATLGLAMSVALLAVAVAFEPPPPIVTFSLASLAFAAARGRPLRRTSVDPSSTELAAP